MDGINLECKGTFFKRDKIIMKIIRYGKIIGLQWDSK